MSEFDIEIEEFQKKKRKSYIKKIEELTDSNFVGFMMNPAQSMIENEDEDFLEKFLQENYHDDKKKITLFLTTPGGLLEPSIKIIYILNYYSNNNFDVCIPNVAKSAGTIICLGAKNLIMGLTSEIGPVDTQIEYGERYFSAFDYVKSYDNILEKIRTVKDEEEDSQDHLIGAYYLQIEKVDNILMQQCKKANIRVEAISKEILNSNSAYSNSDGERIAKKLISGFIDHNDVINHEKAKNIGLNVKFFDPQHELWRKISDLYYRMKNFMLNRNYHKIMFNSENIFIIEKD